MGLGLGAWGLDIPSNQGLEGALSVEALRVEYAARIRDVYDMACVLGRRHVTSWSYLYGRGDGDHGAARVGRGRVGWAGGWAGRCVYLYRAQYR